MQAQRRSKQRPRTVEVRLQSRSRMNSALVLYAGIVTALLALHGMHQSSRSTAILDYAAADIGSIAYLPKQASSSNTGWDASNPLGIPSGKALNLPSMRVHDDSLDAKRKFYGGAGDQKHLGGFTEMDLEGISPSVWKFMIEKYGVHSLLDVGCGRGISTLWFLRHGVDVLCVEGSHDAVERTMLPNPDSQIVEHDFSRGPWWPEKTYDALWAVEFLEHVSLHNQFNYIATFRKAALIFVTSSRWGGWHHVEVHEDDWWIGKLESFGFRYNANMTEVVRAIVSKKAQQVAPNGKRYRALHISRGLKVFINPVVASLPQHAHLFPEHGCFGGSNKDKSPIHRRCGSGREAVLETKLDPSFHPIRLTPEMDRIWENEVRRHIGVDAAHETVPSGTVSIALDSTSAEKERRREPIRAKIDDSLTYYNASSKVQSGTGATEGKISIEPEQELKSEMTEAEDGVSRNETNHLQLSLNTTDPYQHVLKRWERGELELSDMPKIPVVVWPLLEGGPRSAESLHIEQNGINESSVLTLRTAMHDDDPNMVWVGDTGYKYSGDKWCQEFHKRLVVAQEARRAQGLSDQWPVFMVDFTDGYFKFACRNVEHAVGKDFVYYSKRSRVNGRVWVYRDKWVKSGNLLGMKSGGFEYRHTPLVVRTDTIETLAKVLESPKYDMPLNGPIENLERTVDVSHFWPTDGAGVSDLFSNLRNHVSNLLVEMGKKEGIEVFVGLVGDAVRTGRREVQSVYLEAMLDSKIIVVTQRDR